jgi:hypothetical protein
MARRGPIILAVFLLALLPGICRGDGKVFPVINHRADIPEQQALIVWRDGVETLAIETRFVGTGTDFAWVVPLPSIPEVSPATTGLFPTLRVATEPELVSSGVAAAGCWFLGWVVVLLLAMRWARTWGEIGVVVIIVIACPVMLLPAFGKSRGVGVEPGVSVHNRQIVGAYETATVSGKDGGALTSWLSSNGFATSPEAKPIIDDYAARGWCFVAAKLRRAESNEKPATPRPLVFTFAAAEPVYPLRLTGAGSNGLGLELYVFGSQAAAAPGLEVIRCSRVRFAGPLDGWATRLSEHRSDAIAINHTTLRSLALGTSVVTRLAGRLSPAQMRADLAITWEPFAERRARYWSYPGAAACALCVALAALLLGSVVSDAVRLVRRGPSPSLWRAPAQWAVIGMAFGLGVFVFLPKIATTDGRVSRHARWALSSVHYELYRLVHEGGPALTLDGLRAELAKAEPDLPPEEDAPGSFTLSRSEAGFEIRTFGPSGLEYRLAVPFDPEPATRDR